MRPVASRLSPLMSRGDKAAVLFICDMQDKFQPLIHRFDSILSKVKLLSDACKILVRDNL